MNAFEIAAAALLFGFVPLGIVAVRSRPIAFNARAASKRASPMQTG